MATSSIKKNFIVYGEEQVETFANAIEQSINDKAEGKYTLPDVKVNHLKGDSLLKFIENYKRIH